MINNLIKLGENTDVIPFIEEVDSNQEIVQMSIDFDGNHDFTLKNVQLLKKLNQKVFYIKPTKTINSGKSSHNYIADFRLSGSLIDKKSDGEKDYYGIVYDNINRNFSYTKDIYNELKIGDDLLSFIEKFYSFVLKDNSKFLKDVFLYEKNYFVDLSKKDLSNLVFVFSFSKKIIDYFNLNTSENKNFYNLGDIEEIIDLYKKLIPYESMDKVNDSVCSFCDNHQNLYSPNKATFYYSFAKSQETGFYGLNVKNNSKQFIICSECLKQFNKGKKFLKSFLENKMFGVNYFLLYNFQDGDFSSFMKKVEKNNISSIFSKEEMKSKLHELKNEDRWLFLKTHIGKESKQNIDLVFFEDDNGIRIIKTIKEIFPGRLLKLLNENNNLSYFSINAFLINLFNSKSDDDYNLLIKQRINLFEKILLNTSINYDSLLERFLKNVSYKLRNDSNNKSSDFTIYFIKFLELLSKLNCSFYSYQVKKMKLNENEINTDSFEQKIKGKKGVEKLNYFIENNTFFAKIPEIKAGIPLGVTISRLTNHAINDYDKKVLGFARKKLKDKKSLKRFVNEIQEKVVLHDMVNQPIVSLFFENIDLVFSKEKFSKDDFIFGLFLGHSLANKFVNDKGEKNEN